MSENLQLIPGTLPEGYCWTTPQAFYNKMFELGYAIFPGNFNTFNYGNSTPAADDRDKPWLRTVAGAPDRWYVWSGGAWVWPHQAAASGSERRIWVGSLVNLYLYDGGDGDDPAVTAPTATTGAMWEQDSAFDGRFPIGVGTTPGGTSVAVLGTDGNDLKTIAEANLPSHKHLSPWYGSLIGSNAWDGDTNPEYGYTEVSTAAGKKVVDDSSGNYSHPDRVQPYTSSTGSGTQLDVLNPCIGIYVIKRTARIYYTAS